MKGKGLIITLVLGAAAVGYFLWKRTKSAAAAAAAANQTLSDALKPPGTSGLSNSLQSGSQGFNPFNPFAPPSQPSTSNTLPTGYTPVPKVVPPLSTQLSQANTASPPMTTADHLRAIAANRAPAQAPGPAPGTYGAPPRTTTLGTHWTVVDHSVHH